MVTKVQFQDRESRVLLLEQNVATAQNPDVKYLQNQLDRLDPAQKSMAFVGFKNESTWLEIK